MGDEGATRADRFGRGETAASARRSWHACWRIVRKRKGETDDILDGNMDSELVLMLFWAVVVLALVISGMSGGAHSARRRH
jgi:hypothetical protein